MMTSTKSVTRMVAVMAATALVGFGSQAFAQSGSGQSRQPDQQQTRQQRQTEQTKMAKGDLMSVDADAKTLTIRDADGTSMEFKYTDATKVTGSQRGVAGLATMSGESVTIHYRQQAMDKVATEIGVGTDAGSNANRPTQRPNAPGTTPGTTPGATPGTTPDATPGR